MATWRRMTIAAATWIAIAVYGIIHYRVFVPHLLPLATETHSGPFSGPVEIANNILPPTALIIGVAVLYWAIAGGVQEERAQSRRRY